ncbi:MAG TPA: aromatic amino acid lyase [Streptosporangiaceae bacterium]
MTAARTLAAAEDLDAALICAVAGGRPVRIGRDLSGRVRQRCAAAREVLSGGALVYGVNTGLGALADVRLTESQQRSHQRNLLLARATGGPPWLDAADARALLAVRLRTFLSGDSGVSAELCQRLVDFLDADIVPAVPRTGAGSAGEIIPLAHAFGPLAGIGQVLGPAGETRPARDALSEHGLDEFPLGPKEGIALLAGVPGATALCVRRCAEAVALQARMEAAAALSIVAARAPRDPYLDACARGDEVLGQVLRRLRQAIGEVPGAHVREPSAPEPSPSEPNAAQSSAPHPRAPHPSTPDPRAPHPSAPDHSAIQAPASFRVAGPVLTHLLRSADRLASAASRALTGVTDSPAFLDGRFVGTAGFHGLDLSAHCDQLTAALTHACEVSAARVHRLLDPRVTGLPAQLAATPGPDTGLVTVHKRAAGEIHAMRRLAIPAATGLIETSGGQEDVQSFAWEAAEALRQAMQHAEAVTACEFLTAYQAIALSGRPAPPGCRGVLDWLAGIVGPIDADRPFGEDIERLRHADWPAG